MCGLTGVLALRLPADSALEAMTNALRHRGPDDSGVWKDDDAGIALGHRRLAIIDVSPAGHQPMHSACGRYVLSFNGEIYNHQELREELDRAGRSPAWRGHSDTETLLECFVVWGIPGTLERTVGMFAISLWDRAERRLYLARDRFGEKPLYYGWTRDGFVFASELKALQRYPGFEGQVDRDVLALYLQYCYVPAPYSIYRGIYKLEPGCLLSLSLVDAASPPGSAPFAPARRGGLVVDRYWSFADAARRSLADPITDEHQAVEALEATLSRAVRLQSIADVPLGAFLSGGLDSSTIVALMQAQANSQVRTFTIGFVEAGFNEAEAAKAVARHLGTDHTELYVTAREALDVIPLLPDLYCEPFGDSSQIPTHLVSRIARQHVTVALSGDAGDELLGGYNRHFWAPRVWRSIGWLPRLARSTVGAAIQGISPAGWDAVGKRLPRLTSSVRLGEKAHKVAHRLRTVNSLDELYRSLITEWPLSSGVAPGARGLPTLFDQPNLIEGVREAEHRMMLWDTLTYLPDDILHKVDRAAMAASLETRVPFLDHHVVELAWRMPLRMKIRDGKGKWILRQLLYRHVPRALVDRPKAGFAIPVGQWLRGPLRAWAEALLDESKLGAQGFLDPAVVREKWAQHLAGTHDWTTRLWPVLMFQSWIGSNR